MPEESKAKNQSVTINVVLPVGLKQAAEMLVELGLYSSVSEVIREGIRTVVSGQRSEFSRDKQSSKVQAGKEIEQETLNQKSVTTVQDEEMGDIAYMNDEVKVEEENHQLPSIDNQSQDQIFDKTERGDEAEKQNEQIGEESRELTEEENDQLSMINNQMQEGAEHSQSPLSAKQVVAAQGDQTTQDDLEHTPAPWNPYKVEDEAARDLGEQDRVENVTEEPHEADELMRG